MAQGKRIWWFCCGGEGGGSRVSTFLHGILEKRRLVGLVVCVSIQL